MSLKDVAFDLSDQLVIEHETEKELLRKLEKEVPPFVDNVIIGTALERERRTYWRQIFNELNDVQKLILKFLSMVSEYDHWSDSNLQKVIFNEIRDTSSFQSNLNHLWNKGIIQINQLPNKKIWKIDPIVEPFIQEFLFEEE